MDRVRNRHRHHDDRYDGIEWIENCSNPARKAHGGRGCGKNYGNNRKRSEYGAQNQQRRNDNHGERKRSEH